MGSATFNRSIFAMIFFSFQSGITMPSGPFCGQCHGRAAKLSPAKDHSVLAPARNHCPISARSASVMPVALFIGMTLVTTACW